MSRAYKCDTCGAYFDDFESYGGHGASLEGKGLLYGLRSGWYPDKLEICPKCAKGLRQSIKTWFDEVFILGK